MIYICSSLRIDDHEKSVMLLTGIKPALYTPQKAVDVIGLFDVTGPLLAVHSRDYLRRPTSAGTLRQTYLFSAVTGCPQPRHKV